MENLPFDTPEEKRLVLKQAKEGEPVAVAFLMRAYSLRVWTQEEIDSLNLLLEADSQDELTQHYNWLRKESERVRLFKVQKKRVEERAGGSEAGRKVESLD